MDNLDLLLTSDASHVHGTLDGEMWHCPDIVYGVHRLIPTLPHIHGVLGAFFHGAARTWICFLEQFSPHGAITLLSADERHQAYMNAMNDHNKGALGAYQVGA